MHHFLFALIFGSGGGVRSSTGSWLDLLLALGKQVVLMLHDFFTPPHATSFSARFHGLMSSCFGRVKNTRTVTRVASRWWKLQVLKILQCIA